MRINYSFFKLYFVLIIFLSLAMPIVVLSPSDNILYDNETSKYESKIVNFKINDDSSRNKVEFLNYDIDKKDFAQTHVLVQMDKGVDSKILSGYYGIREDQIMDKGNISIVSLPEGEDPAVFAHKLINIDGVKNAAPDHFYNLLEYNTTPNDPGYTSPVYGWWQRDNGLNIAPLWGALNNNEYGPRANSDEIKVAVLDSGYYLNHPDRGPNIIPMKDEIESIYWDGISGYVINTDNDVTPAPLSVMGNDENKASHGTFVAGQISSGINNGIGVAGVGYDTKVLIYKVAGKYYDSPSDTIPELVITDSAIINGIDDAISDGADIISMSLGSTYYNPLLQDAINRAYNAGVMVVAAAGNEGKSNYTNYPAANKNVIAVGSYNYELNQNKKVRASHSNYGMGADPLNAKTNNGQLDILAPGVSIYGLFSTNSYATWSGTSMATPSFAASAALLWRFSPDSSVDEITELIFRSAIPDGIGQPNLEYGWGYLNPVNTYISLKSVSPSAEPPTLTAPSITKEPIVSVSWPSVSDVNATYKIYVNDLLTVSKQTATSIDVALVPNTTNEIKMVVNSKTNWYGTAVKKIISDTIAPSINSLSYKNGVVYWSHNETGDYIQEYSVDGGTYQTVIGSNITLKLTPGNHTFSLRINDSAQNVAIKNITFNNEETLHTNISVNSRSFLYSSAVNLSGRLTNSDGKPLAGRKVLLYRKFYTTSANSYFATAITNLNGIWVYSYNPSISWERNHFITAYYAGENFIYKETKATGLLTAYISISTPKKSLISPRAKRLFTITGTVKPKFRSGTYPIKALFYKKNNNGTYVYVKSVLMKSYNYYSYSKISRTTSLYSKGNYRVRFQYTTGTKSYLGYNFGTTYTSYHYFTVN